MHEKKVLKQKQDIFLTSIGCNFHDSKNYVKCPVPISYCTKRQTNNNKQKISGMGKNWRNVVATPSITLNTTNTHNIQTNTSNTAPNTLNTLNAVNAHNTLPQTLHNTQTNT
jgi:hypothetical protein